MRARKKMITWALVAITAMQQLTLPIATAENWFRQPTTVEQLARKIDRVQKHLDQYGTIATKSPDIWGESRLLRHREEFEQELTKELGKFEFRLSAVESTRDVAFLASALAAQNALGQGGNFAGFAPATKDSPDNTVISVTNQLIPTSSTLDSKDNEIITRSADFGPRVVSNFDSYTVDKDGKPVAAKLSIEPEIFLDQKARYLNHLHEIRRLNEGDDTADSPGYALNLVRIPVSILPGKMTRIGHGAEVTISVEPYLSDELLPNAFRDFVINGVVDRLAPTITRALGLLSSDSDYEKFKHEWEVYVTNVLSKSKDPLMQGSMEIRGIDNTVISNQESADFFEWSKTRGRQEAFNGGGTAYEVVGEKRFLYDAGGTSRRSKLSLPPTYDIPVSGNSLVTLIIDARKHLQTSSKEPVHLEDVRRYLKAEANSTFEYLSQPDAAVLWSYCSPGLVNVIQTFQRELPKWLEDSLRPINPDVGTPSIQRIRTLRGEFYRHLDRHCTHSSFSTTSSLAWQIIVESALLNERLVQDMREIASHKNCQCMPVDWMPFYGPNPPPEARMAFKEYVKCRWPIHVFTLDPVTQDQNVGESFSQRREMQLALAIAAANRLISLQSLSRFIRRMEYDLETIELNRTAVGFTHGDDTFGWRFYPRVQSPPVPGNIQATFQDLLRGSRSRDDLARERMLEPGIRECTALVVMPSFVPYLLVDMRTNWFKLADCKLGIGALNRKMDLEKSVEFSRDIVEMRQLSQACVQDQHLYRDGEVHRLCKAVDQIERSLPLQTAYAQIPYENRLSGFEIFNSGMTDLGPELIDWYGGPGVYISSAAIAVRNFLAVAQNAKSQLASAQAALATARLNGDTETITKLEADVAKAKSAADEADAVAESAKVSQSDTTLFLVGKNFTSLGAGTRVIAGGADVTDTKKLISRDVIQVSIPSNVNISKDPTNGDSVEVQIATPHGVTSHLRIRVIPDNKPVTVLSDADITKKIKDAVEASEKKSLSIIQFSWDSNEVAGCLDVFRTINTWDLRINGGVNLKIENLSPESFLVEQVQVSGWVSIYPKAPAGKTATAVQLVDRATRKRVALGPFQVLLDRPVPNSDSSRLGDQLNLELGNQLVNALATADLGSIQPDEIEKIEIDTFVRAIEPAGKNGHSDPLPVQRTTKPLVIKLKTCTPVCPPVTGQASAGIPGHSSNLEPIPLPPDSSSSTPQPLFSPSAARPFPQPVR